MATYLNLLSGRMVLTPHRFAGAKALTPHLLSGRMVLTPHRFAGTSTKNAGQQVFWKYA